MLVDSVPLIAALDRFGPLYMAAMARRFTWRLGVASRGLEADTALIAACEKDMRENALSPDAFFFLRRGGRNADGELGDMLKAYRPIGDEADPFWSEAGPPQILIEEVERIWSAIDRNDDWQPLHDKVADIRRLGEALGDPDLRG
jgi:hypothetical protein